MNEPVPVATVMPAKQQVEYADDVLDAPAKEPEEPTAAQQIASMQGATTGIPSWATIPEGLRIPRGRQVIFLRFPSVWTDAPKRGIQIDDDDVAVLIAGKGGLWRTCVCWPNSVGDTQMAYRRAMGDVNRAHPEVTRQMIRAIDGKLVDFTGVDNAFDAWWNEIGERNRNIVGRIWKQLHQHDEKVLALFFASCVAVRSAD